MRGTLGGMELKVCKKRKLLEGSSGLIQTRAAGKFSKDNISVVSVHTAYFSLSVLALFAMKTDRERTK